MQQWLKFRVLTVVLLKRGRNVQSDQLQTLSTSGRFKHDIHAVDQIPCRHAAKEGYGDHAPEHHFKRQRRLRRRHAGVFKGLLDQRRTSKESSPSIELGVEAML